jgi:hypothetical protein
MTNNDIYNHANNLLGAFEDVANLSLPVKVHFYFQKNMDFVVKMAQDIEKSRTEILDKYGTLDQETQTYKFEEADVEKVNQDMMDLFSLEQEVKIHVIPMEWIEDMELTAKQVNAFSFMFDMDDEEEE